MESDLAQLYSHFESQIEVMKWTSLGRTTTKQESTKRLNQVLKHDSLGDFGVWGLFSNNNELLVWLMLKKTDLQFPEVGYMVNRQYQNQGLASKVLKDLVEYSFYELKLSAISARVLNNNKWSNHLLKKAGFSIVKNDDLIIYELKGQVLF